MLITITYQCNHPYLLSSILLAGVFWPPCHIYAFVVMLLVPIVASTQILISHVIFLLFSFSLCFLNYIL
uniref:Uncharacterized protein LOC103942834 n=1 Tax=Rhizophora mucronata TaxID=61149 RepID=A0A2P2KBS8_RHIMU